MKKLLVLPVMLLIVSFLQGQNLDRRWNSLLDRANTYKSHKVIKEHELTDMWHVVQDTLALMRVKIKQEQKKVQDQKDEIARLEAKMKENTAGLNQAVAEKNQVLASTARANGFVHALLIALGIVLLACGFLFYIYKKSNNVTMQKKMEYDQLSKSFEEYKAQKLEVERKLKREIQTYMNKFEEMRLRH